MPGSTEDISSAENIILREVRSVTRGQQRAFLALQNAQRCRYGPLLGIVKTNMLPLGGTSDSSGGLFLEALHINHSCWPNVQHSCSAA